MTVVSASTREAEAWFAAALEQPALRCRFGMTVEGAEWTPERAEYRAAARPHLKLAYAEGVTEDIFFDRTPEGGTCILRRVRNGSGLRMSLHSIRRSGSVTNTLLSTVRLQNI